MAFSLSTSWFKIKNYTPEKLIDKLITLEINTVELEYRIPGSFWEKLKPLLKKEGIKISSIHNFFPIPEILQKGGGDAFLLTSLDKNELNLALKYSSRSIEIASEMEAPVVIFHTGNVPLQNKIMGNFLELFDRGEKNDAKNLLKNLMIERGKNSKVYLDRLLIAIEKLLKIAEKQGVKIGIENRYFPNEIPLPEELDAILKNFSGAPLGYWHDFGHAHHIEILGITSHKEWLKKFNEFLLGVHLHDAKGREDHLSPGKGEINYYEFRKLLPKDKRIIKVVEVHSKVTEKELKEGFKFLKKIELA